MSAPRSVPTAAPLPTTTAEAIKAVEELAGRLHDSLGEALADELAELWAQHHFPGLTEDQVWSALVAGEQAAYRRWQRARGRR